MPGTDKNGVPKATDKNQQQQSNGSTPTTTSTTPTTTTALQQQGQPIAVPGPSSSAGMIVQSTNVLGPCASAHLPTPSTSNMSNHTGLMSNPIATKKLVNAKFIAFRNQMASLGVTIPTRVPTTSNTKATPTPSCNAVSVPHGTTFVKPEAICPSPPDWDRDCAKALQAGTSFTRTSIDPLSPEYSVISDLVSDLNFTQIERVVNMGLWTKFKSARRESLLEKSNDLDLMKGLHLHPKMAEIQCQTIKKFKMDPSMATAQYSDNMALLFHGTKGNLEDILVQGLDERLGSSQGLLGRGLYFADNPIKSIAYDTHGVLIIFAVYLGDCMAVDHLTSNKRTFVREPKKLDNQMRTPKDLFFDSIVGKPNPLTPANEYVIYNRHKCCPLYIVSYDKKNPRREKPWGEVDRYVEVRNKIPSFAWKPNTLSDSSSSTNWPFFAKVIFEMMKKKKDENDSLMKEMEQEATDTVIKLSLILELGLPGFTNDSVNLKLLRQFNFDLEKTIDHILVMSQPTTTTQIPMEVDDGIEIVYSSIKSNSPTNSNSSVPKILLKLKKNEDGDWNSVALNGVPPQSPIRTPLKEDCLICCNEFPPTPNHWVVLKCTHKLCTDCHRNILTEGETMGGVKHKSVKCPFCQSIDGIQIGTCPTGTMKVAIYSPVDMHCEGYEDYGVIQTTYEVNQGKHKLKRQGLLPNSPDGLKVSKLLYIAWDRRLCFSIGTSVTTGETDVLVWNIHHKTNLKGGSVQYGYPDPTYLARVTQELKQLGVE